jgi:DHA1 family bicyclomycin/chloramphenicol resistance-like MFS transporter
MAEARPRPPSIPLLFAMLYAGQMASTINLPGLPDIARDFDTSASSVQLMVAVYLGAFAFAQLVMGPLSDRFGRRPVIVGGLGLFALASVLCPVAPDIGTLLVARVVQAAGACATIVVSRAMIRDTAEGLAAAQAMSWFAIALAVGPATAPVIGSLLTASLGWEWTFFATALASAGVLLFVLLDLDETLPPAMRAPPRASQLLASYARLGRNPEFVGYSLIVALAAAAAQAYLTAIPIVFIDLMGVSPGSLGFYITVMPMIFVAANFVARRLIVRMPMDRIILIGVAFSATGGLLQLLFGLWGVTTPYPVVLAFAVSNFGTGLVFANCYAQALGAVPPAIAGQASALSGFMHMGWAGLLALSIAGMDQTSSLPLGIAQATTTGLAALTATVLILVIKRRKRKQGG